MCYYAVPFWPFKEQIRVKWFHLFKNTATNSATSEHGAVPERIGPSEGTRNKPSSTTKILKLKHSKLACIFEHESWILLF